ncbi:MAG: phosphotransferase, partial [Chloroflexi bacterium]|nr:phosphotransferase [Chloroflexota bacterium]
MTGVTHDGMAVEPGDALAALGFRAVADPMRLTGGWDTLLWRFTADDGSDHVLRCFHLPGAADTARRERIALEACAVAGLAAPGVEAGGEFNGLPVFVLSWGPGTPMLTLLDKRPWAVRQLCSLFG